MRLSLFIFFNLFILLTSCADSNGEFNDTSKLPNLTLITSADYMVTFESNWNATNFPSDFPLNPNFGEALLINHNNKGNLFSSGAVASIGLTDFLLNANRSTLENDLTIQQNEMNTNWYSLGILDATTTNPPFNFTISSNKPLISFCVKINPSPNWFLGLTDFSLLQSDGSWTESTQVSLKLYDTDGFTQPSTTYSTPYSPIPNGLITNINPTVLSPTPSIEIGKLIFTKL